MKNEKYFFGSTENFESSHLATFVFNYRIALVINFRALYKNKTCDITFKITFHNFLQTGIVYTLLFP